MLHWELRICTPALLASGFTKDQILEFFDKTRNDDDVIKKWTSFLGPDDLKEYQIKSKTKAQGTDLIREYIKSSVDDHILHDWQDTNKDNLDLFSKEYRRVMQPEMDPSPNILVDREKAKSGFEEEVRIICQSNKNSSWTFDSSSLNWFCKCGDQEISNYDKYTCSKVDGVSKIQVSTSYLMRIQKAKNTANPIGEGEAAGTKVEAAKK